MQTTMNYEQRLSPHFTLGEFLRSGTAIRHNIRNVPSAHPQDGLTNDELIANLTRLCTEVLEPLRRRVGRVTITSGYRCKELNARVGGVPKSHHLQGLAADIYVSSTAMAERYAQLLRLYTPCDELIIEPVGDRRKRWVHVSVKQK